MAYRGSALLWVTVTSRPGNRADPTESPGERRVRGDRGRLCARALLAPRAHPHGAMTSIGRSARVLMALVPLVAGCGPASDGGARGLSPSVPAPTTTTTTIPTTTTTPTTTSTTTTSTTTTTTTTTTTAPATTAPPAAAAPQRSIPRHSAVLDRGDSGAAVRDVQQRLHDLRYWVIVDGDYGWLTEQAVYAFQKANGITVDGRVGPETRAALADPLVPAPRSTHGRVIEIDKERQLLYTVVDGELEWVFHTSTGTEDPYRHPSGRTALADTPGGTHSVFWQVDGWDDGVLGPLYRPKYFHQDGIAVHGYGAVPPYPASHGCVRLTFVAMDYVWANDLMPVGSTVSVYGVSREPRPAV